MGEVVLFKDKDVSVKNDSYGPRQVEIDDNENICEEIEAPDCSTESLCNHLDELTLR